VPSRSALAAFAVFASAIGCYSTTAIRPDQLPLLNGSFAVATGSYRAGSRTVTTGQVSVAHVAAPDGRIVEIAGPFDAILVARDPRNLPLEFDHPVEAQLDGMTLRVAGANRAPVGVPLEGVSEVRIRQFDGATTSWAIVGVTIAAIVLGGALVLFAWHPGPSSGAI